MRTKIRKFYCRECNETIFYSVPVEFMWHNREHEIARDNLARCQMVERAVDAAWEKNW